MSFSNDLPFFYRATNPNVAHIKQVTSKLYQWDGTSTKPQEVVESRSAAGPLNVNLPGTATIWSDTYTLGYTNENEASPIFFEVGDKPGLLKAINSVAKRLGVSKFSNLTDAKTWAFTESRIYLNDLTSARPSGINGDGLFAELDASDTNSYPGTGSTWYDLTGNGYNATLTNLLGGPWPNYVSDAGGAFDINGTFSGKPAIEFNSTNSISDFEFSGHPESDGITFQVWAYIPHIITDDNNGTSNNKFINIFHKGADDNFTTNPSGSQNNGGFIFRYDRGGIYTYPSSSGSTILREVGDNAVNADKYDPEYVNTRPFNNQNRWNLFTIEFLREVPKNVSNLVDHPETQAAYRIYVNGDVLHNQYASPKSEPFNTYFRWPPFGPGSYNWSNVFTNSGSTLKLGFNPFGTSNVKIGAFYAYNRSLTEQEVISNFNNTKSRFGR